MGQCTASVNPRERCHLMTRRTSGLLIRANGSVRAVADANSEFLSCHVIGIEAGIQGKSLGGPDSSSAPAPQEAFAQEPKSFVRWRFLTAFDRWRDPDTPAALAGPPCGCASGVSRPPGAKREGWAMVSQSRANRMIESWQDLAP